VGPGLDFTDKLNGYDFYPEQTIQPFAVIDSLVRLGLAKANDIRLTTLDLSSRVNQHLEAARRRAGTDGYLLYIPRDTDAAWHPDLVAYWKRLGDRIGDQVATAPAPVLAGHVDVRGVRIRPSAAEAITPLDMNIVLQRLAPLPEVERFDLVIATNVLVYYGMFEKSLALANIASMLREGGILLCNNALPILSVVPVRSIGYNRTQYSNNPDDADAMGWYRRQ
jgi:hypothetical protein